MNNKKEITVNLKSQNKKFKLHNNTESLNVNNVYPFKIERYKDKVNNLQLIEPKQLLIIKKR